MLTVLNIAPVKEKIKLVTDPVTITNKIDFKAATTIPSLLPKNKIVIKTTIFERPNLAPGIATGVGNIISNKPMTKPKDTSSDKKIIFLILNVVPHPLLLCL